MLKYCLIGALGTNFKEILIDSKSFIQENAFESVVCVMAAILSRPQCVNTDMQDSKNHSKGVCPPGSYYWNYYLGALFLCQVTTTHLKIMNLLYPYMKSMRIYGRPQLMIHVV